MPKNNFGKAKIHEEEKQSKEQSAPSQTAEPKQSKEQSVSFQSAVPKLSKEQSAVKNSAEQKLNKEQSVSFQSAVPKLSKEQSAVKNSAEPTSVINEGIQYDGDNFYIAVKPQLDEMFECYPEEARLNELISNSRWVRIDCDGEYYVVGVINTEDGAPELVAYGIPGTYPVKPPEEISDVCEWFPLDFENKYGDGFWLIYQDAHTGKCLKNS